MKRALLLSTFCLASLGLSAQASAAPLVDLELGGYVWSPSYSGSLGDSNATLDELGIEEKSSTTASVTFEHAVPIIPNIKIARTNLSTSGTSSLSANFTFDSKTFTTSTDVSTELDLSHTDFTVFYGLPEIGVDIDLGLTFRVFDGEVNVYETNNPSNSDTVALDEVLPMGYASARFDLPGTGFFVNGEINGIALDGNSVTDTMGRVGYSKSIVPAVLDLEVSLGYRKFEITIDDDNVTAEGSASGPFANLSVVF